MYQIGIYLLSMFLPHPFCFFFFFNDPAPTEIYPLSLHDALPISAALPLIAFVYDRWGFDMLFRVLAVTAAVILGTVSLLPRQFPAPVPATAIVSAIAILSRERSEEHTSELQSHSELVCRPPLEKKMQAINPRAFSTDQRAAMAPGAGYTEPINQIAPAHEALAQAEAVASPLDLGCVAGSLSIVL